MPDATVVTLLLVALGIPFALTQLARILRGGRRAAPRGPAFESGIRPEVDSRRRFSQSDHLGLRLWVVGQIGVLLLVAGMAAAFASEWQRAFALVGVAAPVLTAVLFVLRRGAVDWE